MVRLLAAFAALALFAGFASSAIADDRAPRSAGSKGTVTAWDEYKGRVLEHRFCVRTRYSWDYASCGNRLRDELKRNWCAQLGPGMHRYYYQVGDGRPVRATLVCRRS